MANPSISFTDRYSSTLQPLLLLSTDYLAIIIAEWCAVGGRDIVLELLGRKNDWFELNNFYFYLFVPLIFMVFLHWGQNLYSFAFYWRDDSENFLLRNLCHCRLYCRFIYRRQSSCRFAPFHCILRLFCFRFCLRLSPSCSLPL